jgi:hypothetical protein
VAGTKDWLTSDTKDCFCSSESGDGSGDSASGSSDWRSFDMHSVVAATEDLFDFIL